MNGYKKLIAKYRVIFLAVGMLILWSGLFSASTYQLYNGFRNKTEKQEKYQTWHEQNLAEVVPKMITIGNTASSTDFYGIEKVVYMKASYNALAFGLTKDLVISNIDGSYKDTILQDIPDTSGLSRFILLPETKETILAVPGVTTLQKIDFEKINLETRERIKLGMYEEKQGVELEGAIVSPDQNKLVFTTSGMRVFLMDLDRSGAFPDKPIYTHSKEAGGMLIPGVWDKSDNVYFSYFSCFPCLRREPEKNTDSQSLSYILQMNVIKKRLIFFRNIESYAFSPDNNYFAWVERQEDDPNMKVKVYSAKEDVIRVVDNCKVLSETLSWRDATHIQYRVADEYPWYANIVYDVESHIKNTNPVPPSYKVEGRITHDIKIEEGGERGSVENAKLYIDGVLIDSIQEIVVGYGHSSSFEILGFIHGKPMEDREAKPLYPSYLPEGINTSNLYEYNKCFGVICTTDIVGNFGVLRIQQFIDLESLYFPDDMIDDTATFRHLIRKKEDVTFDAGKGTYYDLGTLPGERRLYFTKGKTKIQFFCYGGCTLSKEELVKIAQSMTTEINYSTVDTSTWQTYRNEEFGFEVRYPAYYEKDMYEYDQRNEYGQRVRRVGFGYSQGDYSNNVFISVFDDAFENFEISHRGGDTDVVFRFDAMRKQWLAHSFYPPREGEEQEWVPADEHIQKVEGLPFEAYTHTTGPLPIGCVGKGAVIPHPSYSFVVSIHSDKCLNDITIDDPKDGPLSSIGIDQILSTFRFVE